MALIKCPNCGGEISDKALVCPKCSFVLKEPKKTFCSECGAEIPEGVTACPNCGNPIVAETTENVQKVELSKVAVPKVKMNKKLLLALAAAALVVIGIFAGISSNKEKEYVSPEVEIYQIVLQSRMLQGSPLEEINDEGDIPMY